MATPMPRNSAAVALASQLLSVTAVSLLAAGHNGIVKRRAELRGLEDPRHNPPPDLLLVRPVGGIASERALLADRAQEQPEVCRDERQPVPERGIRQHKAD